MHRQNPLTSTMMNEPTHSRELPIGSELMIAFTLGLAGWWGIVHLVMWLAA